VVDAQAPLMIHAEPQLAGSRCCRAWATDSRSPCDDIHVYSWAG
jgi:hypothetical protein